MMRYWAMGPRAAVEVTLEELQGWAGGSAQEWFDAVQRARGAPPGVEIDVVVAGMHLVPLSPELQPLKAGIDPRG